VIRPQFTPIRIALSESKGAIPSGIHTYDDGTQVEVRGHGTTCPGCGEVPKAGDSITKIFYSWWHDLCGAKHLRDMATDAAWIALGQQLERAPSKFTNPETKAIVRNLLRIAEARVVLPEDPEPPLRREVSRSLHSVPPSDDQPF
jgi:hypothetical protein